jgi:serine/threonine-protein kinase HipA
VWTDLGGAQRRVGLAVNEGGAGEFNYADPYVEGGGHALDPINLPPRRGKVFRTTANGGLFGVLHDAGPDAWGRRVLKSLDAQWMGKAGELDILLRASGHGVGALLFSASRDACKAREPGIGRHQLGAAAEGAHEVEQGEVLRAHLRALMMASTSMGGLHPKIAVTDADGTHWIAKFKARDDLVDTPRVEFASMRLAAKCGIDAAAVELTAAGERPALLVRRFDRAPGGALHYASAHALWNPTAARESDTRDWASYAGIVGLRRQLPGGEVPADAAELFRRLAFNVVIGNTDDHGRNHGFLMDAQGRWRLAPAFDVLPSFRSEVHAIGVGPQGAARDLDNVLAGAAHFGLNQAEARAAVQKVRRQVARHYRGLLEEARCAPADRDAVLGRVLGQ